MYTLDELKKMFGIGVDLNLLEKVINPHRNPFKRNPAFRGSKHQASKKNFKHIKNLSLGEKNHKIFVKHGF